MKNKLKCFFALILCIPVILLVGCGNKKTVELENLSYYFDNNITSTFFNPDSTRNLSLSDLTRSKPNKDLLDSYSEIKINNHSENSRTYHLYIDYIVLYVYTNEDSDEEFKLTLTIDNVIPEDKVGTEPTNKEFKETHTTTPKENSSAEFRFEVNKVIATTSGTSIVFDILETDIFNTSDDSKVTFKWLIYGLEIHAEPRAYNL